MNIFYSLDEMRGIIGCRSIAMIGSGESRLTYVFNPRNVCALAVNKSAVDYPAELSVVVEDHISEVFYLGVRPPIVFIPTLDVFKWNIFNDRGYWTATVLLRYLCEVVKPPVIYLQGFDLSKPKYLPQAKHFLEISQRYREQKIFFSKQNFNMTFFSVTTPERNHYL